MESTNDRVLVLKAHVFSGMANMLKGVKGDMARCIMIMHTPSFMEDVACPFSADVETRLCTVYSQIKSLAEDLDRETVELSASASKIALRELIDTVVGSHS